MEYVRLVNESREQLEVLRQSVERLHSEGIRKELGMGHKWSQIVVTYPPAQNLGDDIGSVLSAAPQGSNTLYVHIPFCSGICTYCNYSRTAASDQDRRIHEYIELLDKESAILKENLGGNPVKVSTIYIGGGTPTLLTEEHLERLLQVINRDYVREEYSEFSLEGSPETVTVGKIALARHYGVNRVSIGVESFNDPTLEAIGRRHDARGAYEALDRIRKGGITNIDFDLIRGLPGYTLDMMVDDVRGVKRAQTPSVTSYQYSLKPRSINHKRGKMRQDEWDAILMHLTFIRGMSELGYKQMPVDFFVKGDEFLYQHQMMKWGKNASQLVLGQSAYGYLNGVQFINFTNRRDYAQAVSEGRLPIERATSLSDEEIMRRGFIFGLKVDVDRNKFKESYGVDPLESPFENVIGKLAEAGGLEVTDTEIRLSEAGVLFADWIQMAFYSEQVRGGNISL